MTSYDKFKYLCDARGIAVSAALQQCGLSKALGTRWKNHPNTVPNGMTLLKLSNFFNVSSDYFVGDTSKAPYNAFLEDPQINRLAMAMLDMTPQQRSEIIHYAHYLAPEAFEK